MSQRYCASCYIPAPPDEGALNCQSCYDGFTFEGGFCDNPCFIGHYPASKDSKRDDPNCRTCDPSCEGCWGPNMWECTLCPASQILSDDGRCLRCCGNKTPRDDIPIPRECCDCEASQTLFSLFPSLLHNVCKKLAEWYFQDGCSVLAACCHLAVDNIQLALASLIRGNELELAACVGLVLGEAANQSTAYCLELLARKYMTTPTWELSADLLQMIPDNHVLLAKLCAFYPGSVAEISQLHERCGLPSLDECKTLAEEAVRDGDLFSAVKFHLLSSEPEHALQIGVDFVKEQLSGSDWTVDGVQPILDLMSYIRTDRLILAKLTQARSELLILCGYIGGLLAIRKSYCSIVPALYEYTSQLLKRREVCVPLKIEQLTVELDAWRACTQFNNIPPSESQREEFICLERRILPTEPEG
ncbi:WD repeat-containing protein 17 [Characodon lateralis]|uniref:WD repeat-containing protein 17 n=1 Tax=Characodon lateralis TaxID=208331 RepID=A0ABU7ENF4_9TELE|nr:WD repeat-containing protein 17 [Characodon lateralis]